MDVVTSACHSNGIYDFLPHFCFLKHTLRLFILALLFENLAYPLPSRYHPSPVIAPRPLSFRICTLSLRADPRSGHPETTASWGTLRLSENVPFLASKRTGKVDNTRTRAVVARLRAASGELRWVSRWRRPYMSPEVRTSGAG